VGRAAFSGSLQNMPRSKLGSCSGLGFVGQIRSSSALSPSAPGCSPTTERAIALRVNDPYVYRRAGEAALALAEMTGAIRYFTVAIERNPRDIVSALRLIECLFQAGDFDGARAVAHHALSIDSNCGQAANWLETIDRARSIKEVEAQL
jgi:tetratricopeptide (TPR) repeat protein